MRDISVIFKSFLKSLLVISLFFMVSLNTVNAQDAKEGKAIFKEKCSSCHALNQRLVGPALAGITEKMPEAWLIKWIQNNQALIKAKDPDALKIYNEYNQAGMPVFSELDEKKVKSILAYLKEGDAKPAAAAGTGGASGGNAGGESTSGVSIIGLAAIFLLAVGILMVLGRVAKMLEKVILQKQDEPVREEVAPAVVVKKPSIADGFRLMLKNKKFVFFLILCIVIFLGSFGWMGMWNTGVHTGYQPVQPIKFSHELHAGTNKIDCQYCHNGAFKSKNATIPSLNVCMNCHKAVQAREKYDGEISPEIKKIYLALGYDPETQKTDVSKSRPIEWIRVHNLPDFAYFNHSQHVVVAADAIRKAKGLKPTDPVCYACHGPVNKMEEIYQYSPLTMKWCINCHRETDISGQKNNAFYTKVIEAHEKIKKGEKITPALLGGLECGKCHY